MSNIRKAMTLTKYIIIASIAFCLGLIVAIPVISAKYKHQLHLQDITHLGARLSNNIIIRDGLKDREMRLVKEVSEREIGLAIIGIVAVEDFQKLSTELNTISSITKAAQYCRNQKINLDPPELDEVFQEALQKIPPP